MVTWVVPSSQPSGNTTACSPRRCASQSAAVTARCSVTYFGTHLPWSFCCSVCGSHRANDLREHGNNHSICSACGVEAWEDFVAFGMLKFPSWPHLLC